MPRGFLLTDREMLFLQSFLDISGLPYADTVTIPTEEELSECVKSLLSKSYLKKDEVGHYYLDETLTLLLRIAEKPWGSFVMESNDRKCVISFLQDCICIGTCQEATTELLWVPFLPLAIGHVANVIGTFLNEKTENALCVAGPHLDMFLEDYQKQGYTVQWKFYTCEAGAPDDVAKGCVMSNSTKQLLLLESDAQTSAVFPAKADYVNALTKLFAPIHSRAIRAGGIIDAEDSN